MVADGARKKNFVSGTSRPWIKRHATQRPPNAGGGDVHGIGFAVFDHFGVAARDLYSGIARRVRHGADFRLQHGVGRPASIT